VTLGLDATIGGKAYTRGQVVHLAVGRYEVVAGGVTRWLTLRAACTLRGPDLDCYP